MKGRINAAQQKLLQEQFDQAAHPQFDLESIAGELVNVMFCCLLSRCGFNLVKIVALYIFLFVFATLFFLCFLCRLVTVYHLSPSFPSNDVQGKAAVVLGANERLASALGGRIRENRGICC